MKTKTIQQLAPQHQIELMRRIYVRSIYVLGRVAPCAPKEASSFHEPARPHWFRSFLYENLP